MRARRLGLRAKVIISVAVGALLLSVVLSVVTYSFTRSNLTDARKSGAFDAAETRALSINGQLGTVTPPDFITVMSQVFLPNDTLQGILTNDSSQYADSLRLSDDKLDPSFFAAVKAGRPAQMTFVLNDEPHYVVALPIPSAGPDAFYVEAVPLSNVEQALNSLLPTLAGAGTITTILGLAFGVYVSKRLLIPIEEISDAATQIAAGDLSTRLDTETDPDLEPLVQSFNGMTSALQERIERDSRFASDVSHELRSPLMTLTGSVAVLERSRDDLPERSQVALDLLSADIKRFKLLVEDLLEISRFDIGVIELETVEVVFGEFVRQAMGAAVGRTRDVPIIHDEHSDELIISLDKRRVAQVIRNLSENADKYAGGVTQIRLHQDGDGVRIELEDEGPGVPEDERELIFERFARGSEGGRRGSGSGVGLGLSLVTEHLRLHGGSIHVADRVDGLTGARFVITLNDVVVVE